MTHINMNLEAISEAAKQFPWEDKASYARFLAQTYYYVRHSTRLLALAAGVIALDDKKSFDRYIKHISEERNHEQLARLDLTHMGYDLDQMPELSATRLLWEPQYYKVMHCSPMALLGYILPLEALAAQEGGNVVKLIEQAHGSKCLHFLKLHGEEDIKHVQDAIRLADTLPAHERVLVEQNIDQTIHAYVRWLSEISAI
ncbi:MAG: hypothetical protein CO186_09975 [Zetaproteobacteria bacterium CG_4_9_14_3_um_filter_49_83]|nr:MAG: hypothetical protein AUJ56_07250 [Zetaproteobacteria bacterium CG1_02_49_23]PIQ34552.1 MAG: hypothetical protein COW62_01195 [Zetaproteobacteria bacterium CG17_big_fil_post_rev_8_21_14_2_50_50_13]PIV29408.1 MAG: hypothetical protein COS35_12130 [Zetaproteobacteria bacterium CG02_land_8_20_14_3_00_50_9]PIY56568.1 MAG: hypothetical protein COZ00_03445 [Zetaproteobacteria bacterium CG_4_10_14_0_8_um_filter_49_80]PJA34617.1 MAG: hypothetical protein CO186_09975 [Zetaproteobacteria bacterium